MPRLFCFHDSLDAAKVPMETGGAIRDSPRYRKSQPVSIRLTSVPAKKNTPLTNPARIRAFPLLSAAIIFSLASSETVTRSTSWRSDRLNWLLGERYKLHVTRTVHDVFHLFFLFMYVSCRTNTWCVLGP